MELKTRIVLRNDSTANWLASSNTVLLKGEFGVEFTADGKAKVKIGDGVKTWEQLDYYGGDTLVADTVSVVVEDGILKIKGFDEAAAGSQLVKGADGSLSWVLPDTTTVEGLTTTVATLQTDVTNIQNNVEVLRVATGGKANANDVYTKAEVDNLLSSVYNYKGTVENYADLPTENVAVGDVYNIANASDGIRAGDNVAWNGSGWDVLSGTVDLSGYVTKEEYTTLNEIVEALPDTYQTKEEAAATVSNVRYEISHKPVTTLVDYRDKEIRIMCPADTKWALQNVGATGDASMYYIGFKAYAPYGAVSFKEDLAKTISDETMYYFEGNDFAGIDKYGRKYSIVWLPAASYDAETDTWSYYGAKSTTKKYIGWHYSVEWYDADGVKIAADTIRINLSNENCHSDIEPFYMADVLKGVSVGGTLLDAVDKQVNIPVASAESFGVVKSSTSENKVAVAEDGTMEVNSISVSKIVQLDDETLVLNGGSASN